MGVSAAVFESAGQRTEHYIPGAYSRSNNVSSPSGVSAGNLVILGNSTGGEPLKLLSFGSLADAKDSLVGGDLLKAIAYAMSGSNVYTPQRVFAVRVNNGTQASRVMKNGDNEILTVKSWDWGSHTNQLKMWLKNGSSGSDYRKIIAAYKDESYEIDDIQKKSLSIEYTGEGESASCTITTTGIKLVALDSEGAEIDTVSIDFEDYPKMDDVVSYINDTGVYVAASLDLSTEAKSGELDTCASIDVTTSAIFYSNLAAIIDALKSIPLVGDVELNEENGRVLPDVDDNFVYFAGGSSGDSKWGDALTMLESEDIQIIATPSTDETVLSIIAGHCTTMSNTINRKERTCWLGAAENESDENAMKKAKNFNNSLISYVIDTVTASNPITGETEKLNGAFLACMLAGMESAMAVNEPLTFKALNILGFSKKRSNTSIENLIKAGVVVCNPNPENANEAICIRAVTTFQGINDLISCERSMIRENLYMNRDLRNKYISGIGHPNDPSIDAIVRTLKDAASDWAISGYIVPDGKNNVWNIKVRISGDKVYLTYSRYLTAPRNFVFITATNHVYESTVEL